MWSRRLSPAAGARRLQTSERRAHRSQRSGTAIRPSAWVPDVFRRRNTGRIDHADTPAVPEPRTAWGQGPPPIGCRARRPVAHERQPRARGAPKKRGFGKSCGFASSAVPARSGGAPRDWFPTRRTRGTRRHGGTLVEQVCWVVPSPERIRSDPIQAFGTTTRVDETPGSGMTTGSGYFLAAFHSAFRPPPCSPCPPCENGIRTRRPLRLGSPTRIPEAPKSTAPAEVGSAGAVGSGAFAWVAPPWWTGRAGSCAA